ncbi:semaphorin-7A isoform X2 [Anolis carolinensis]|uniref:semaphorin-7A isoform X2 n=1 Tax=Anolis carolinensis TaxID=28377 RepID=UPI002F2B6461
MSFTEGKAMAGERKPRSAWLLACFAGLVLPSLTPASSSSIRMVNPRIITSPRGSKTFRFETPENHVVVYHEEGAQSVFVGAENKLYIYNFETNTSHTEPFDVTRSPPDCRKEDNKNYLTLLEKYEDKLLICGTNACSPTCWNWVNNTKQLRTDAQGLAPFGLDSNALVLIDGKDIYSTIKKHRYNGRIPRFRRIKGSTELYTSDTVMNNPQFVKAAIVKQDTPDNDKIYYFFREDNPDWPGNSVAPKIISRVAQLCKGDKGGSGSLSSSKWTTFLKATLFCVDEATDRHFNHLQDIVIVESPVWSETKVYGLFSNEWDYSAVCVFSVGEISEVFRKSHLKGYNGKLPTTRPGQCLGRDEMTPQETFRVADSYPEVLDKVKKQAVFYSKHHYQQLGVHQVQAADEASYNVLYLTTDRGTIHKVVLLPTGAMNVLEIQLFQSSSLIRSMTVDNTRNELFVVSTSTVVQLPLAMCKAYKDSCESCVLARDPHCAWTGDTCASVYDREQYGNRTLLQALTHEVSPDICASSNHSSTKDDTNHHENIIVPPHARYYLNCSVQSHHANYTWIHEGQSIAHCSAGHHHCIHFIDNMTDGFYGTYSCVSQEDWFNETLVTEYLVRPSPETMMFKSLPPGSWATKSSLSFWLGLLNMVAIATIIQ